MADMTQSTVRNRLLRAMPRDAYEVVAPRLQPLRLDVGQTVFEPQAAISRVLFPETGVISVTAGIAVALAGCEGAVGASAALLGSRTSLHHCVVQASGKALAIETNHLNSVADQFTSVRLLLQRYAYTLAIQAEQTAYVNATLDIERRIARLLLMIEDRVPDEVIAMTHEALSRSLAVQRTSVTLALHRLEGRGFIKANRARIKIRDRQTMREFAGTGYGVPESEYARLIGAPPEDLRSGEAPIPVARSAAHSATFVDLNFR